MTKFVKLKPKPMRVTGDDTLVKPHAERVVQHIIPLLPSIVMRDPLAIRSSRDHAFDRDAHESAFLRGVQNEVADREQAEKRKSIPDGRCRRNQRLESRDSH